MRDRIVHAIGGFVFAAVTLWFVLHVHLRDGHFNYKSQIFSDKAGYYLYLPATFVYGWDAAAMPDSLPGRIGQGFYVDSLGKLYTKYPLGVAAMQAPMFMMAHYVAAPLSGQAADGFSPPYHTAVDLSAWACLLIAYGFLWRVLRARFSAAISWAVLMLMLLGTNLLYYYSVESGMSHIYSFCLVCILLWQTERVRAAGRVSAAMGVAMGLVMGLLVMTRFTNAMLLTLPLFWEVGSMQALRQRLRLFWSPGGLLLIPGLLLWLGLQMSYYHYLSGGWWLYSYGNEGFAWLSPQLLKVWFSPQNGLVLHAPLFLLALAGVGRMVRRRMAGGWYLLALFLVASYVFSCWWQWYFGCAYGARSLVEYLPPLMVAAGYALEWVLARRKALRVALFSLMVLLAVVNAKNSYLYKRCYLGSGEWDWGHAWVLTKQL